MLRRCKNWKVISGDFVYSQETTQFAYICIGQQFGNSTTGPSVLSCEVSINYFIILHSLKLCSRGKIREPKLVDNLLEIHFILNFSVHVV